LLDLTFFGGLVNIGPTSSRRGGIWASVWRSSSGQFVLFCPDPETTRVLLTMTRLKYLKNRIYPQFATSPMFESAAEADKISV
jgi:hypothetical protein